MQAQTITVTHRQSFTLTLQTTPGAVADDRASDLPENSQVNADDADDDALLQLSGSMYSERQSTYKETTSAEGDCALGLPGHDQRQESDHFNFDPHAEEFVPAMTVLPGWA